MDLLTKEQLDADSTRYNWNDVPEYEITEEELWALPLRPDNGYEMLDFLNAFAAQHHLDVDKIKRVEALILRQIPAVRESRRALAQWLETHLDELA